MAAYDDKDLPATRFYRDCLRPLIKSEQGIIDELKSILVREFSGRAIWNLSESDLKRFNGRAMSVLKFHGLLTANGERARPAPLRYVVTHGETISVGDRVVQDYGTGKLRKAEPKDLGSFVVPPGSRITSRGYLEMPQS